MVVGGGGSNSQKLGVGVVADQLGSVTSSVVDYVIRWYTGIKTLYWSGAGFYTFKNVKFYSAILYQISLKQSHN